MKNEIPEVKALKWLTVQFPKIEDPKDDTDKMVNCINVYCNNAIDKINSQQGEIERLKNENRHLEVLLQKSIAQTDTAIDVIDERGRMLKEPTGEGAAEHDEIGDIANKVLKEMGVNPNEPPHWKVYIHKVIDQGTREVIDEIEDGFFCSHCGKRSYYKPQKCSGCNSIMQMD